MGTVNPHLGIAIALHKISYYEGTGTLYFCLSSNTDKVALLTCAHITRPLSAFKNNMGVIWKEGSGKPAEEIIMLGDGAYQNAVNAILAFIWRQMNNINVWEDKIKRLPVLVEGEPKDPKVTKKCNELTKEIEMAAMKIAEVDALHSEVMKTHTTADHQIISYVLHLEKIRVNAPPQNYMRDWALVWLYRDTFNWETFKGNKIWTGLSFSSFFLS